MCIRVILIESRRTIARRWPTAGRVNVNGLAAATEAETVTRPVAERHAQVDRLLGFARQAEFKARREGKPEPRVQGQGHLYRVAGTFSPRTVQTNDRRANTVFAVSLEIANADAAQSPECRRMPACRDKRV